MFTITKSNLLSVPDPKPIPAQIMCMGWGLGLRLRLTLHYHLDFWLSVWQESLYTPLTTISSVESEARDWANVVQ